MGILVLFINNNNNNNNVVYLSLTNVHTKIGIKCTSLNKTKHNSTWWASYNLALKKRYDKSKLHRQSFYQYRLTAVE